MRSNQFYDSYISDAIKALNNSGVTMDRVPEEARKKTFALEGIMDIAADKADVMKYMAVVNKWRDIFLAFKPTREQKQEKEIKPWQKKNQNKIQSSKKPEEQKKQVLPPSPTQATLW